MQWLQSLLPALHRRIGGEPELKEDEPSAWPEDAPQTPNGILDAWDGTQRERAHHGVNGVIVQGDAFPRVV